MKISKLKIAEQDRLEMLRLAFAVNKNKLSSIFEPFGIQIENLKDLNKIVEIQEINILELFQNFVLDAEDFSEHNITLTE